MSELFSATTIFPIENRLRNWHFHNIEYIHKNKYQLLFHCLHEDLPI